MGGLEPVEAGASARSDRAARPAATARRPSPTASVNRSRLLAGWRAGRAGRPRPRGRPTTGRSAIPAAGSRRTRGRARRAHGRVAAELTQRRISWRRSPACAGGGQPGPEVVHRCPVGAADVTGVAPGDEARGTAARPRRSARPPPARGPSSASASAAANRARACSPASRKARAARAQSPAAAACRPTASGWRRRQVRGPPGGGRAGPAPESWRRGSPGSGRWRTRSRARRRRAAPHRLASAQQRATACAGRSSIAATTAGSTEAPSTAPARSTSSASRPTRRSRARTTACSDSGAPGSPAASPRRVSTTNSGCPRVRRRIVAASSPWPAPGPAGSPPRPAAGRGRAAARRRPGRRGRRRPHRCAMWRARAAAPVRRAAPGSAAAPRSPGRPGAGRRAAAGSACRRPARAAPR